MHSTEILHARDISRPITARTWGKRWSVIKRRKIQRRQESTTIIYTREKKKLKNNKSQTPKGKEGRENEEEKLREALVSHSFPRLLKKPQRPAARSHLAYEPKPIGAKCQ